MKFNCYRMLAALLAFCAFGIAAQEKRDYTLGAGDGIKIQVFQNPELTVEARVSESGIVNYPLIGAIQLGGLSIAEGESKIADALRKGGFVQKPQVNIVLILVRGNQVAVHGQVNRPGRFPLESFNTRVTDMIAAAGGVIPGTINFPGGDDIAIVTGMREGKPFRKEIDIPALYMENKADDDLLLLGGDSIFIPRAAVFYIFGEAQRPGVYRIERGMTIMQALATGGGPTVRGSDTRLRLHRKASGGKTLQSAPALDEPVQANDVLYVRESLF